MRARPGGLRGAREPRPPVRASCRRPDAAHSPWRTFRDRASRPCHSWSARPTGAGAGAPTTTTPPGSASAWRSATRPRSTCAPGSTCRRHRRVVRGGRTPVPAPSGAPPGRLPRPAGRVGLGRRRRPRPRPARRRQPRAGRLALPPRAGPRLGDPGRRPHRPRRCLSLSHGRARPPRRVAGGVLPLAGPRVAPDPQRAATRPGQPGVGTRGRLAL